MLRRPRTEWLRPEHRAEPYVIIQQVSIEHGGREEGDSSDNDGATNVKTTTALDVSEQSAKHMSPHLVNSLALGMHGLDPVPRIGMAREIPDTIDLDWPNQPNHTRCHTARMYPGHRTNDRSNRQCFCCLGGLAVLPCCLRQRARHATVRRSCRTSRKHP